MTKTSKEARQAGVRRQHAHARRTKPGGPREARRMLDEIPIGARDWRRVVGLILSMHNYTHSSKEKGVGVETMKARRGLLFRLFADLRSHTSYVNVDPRQLGARHVEAAVKLWVGRGLSTATLHNYLSYLRTYAGWLGKPGMVRKASYYVGEASPHAHRHQGADRDRSWSALAIDVEAKVAEIQEVDPWVAVQLELCHQFALRPNEARRLRPHAAVVPRSAAIQRDAESAPDAEFFLQVHEGTKGGRPRDVPITTDRQRELLERVKRMVVPGQFVGNPAQTAAQNRRRFYYVLERFGLTKAGLGVVAHGLRHERANDRYQEVTGVPSPVRGGGEIARDLRKQGRHTVARLLGHNRARVTNCYLGQSVVMRSKAAAGAAEAAADTCDGDRASQQEDHA